jgi:hypothetical protein
MHPSRPAGAVARHLRAAARIILFLLTVYATGVAVNAQNTTTTTSTNIQPEPDRQQEEKQQPVPDVPAKSIVRGESFTKTRIGR